MASAALINFVRVRGRQGSAPAPPLSAPAPPLSALAHPHLLLPPSASPSASASASASPPSPPSPAGPPMFFVGTLYSSARDRGAYLYGRKKDFLRGYEYHVALKDSTGLPVTVEVEGPSKEDRLAADGDQFTIPMLRDTFTLYRDDKYPYDARIV